MKKIILIIASIFIIINITACSSSKQTSLPKWYLNSPSNTHNTLYGTGEAYSLNEAKTNALKNMSEQLVVSVKSSMSTITKTSSSTYDKQLIRDINLKTKKISFSNYKVTKAVQTAGTFYVLVEVDKIELFNEKQEELRLLDNKIDTSINNMQSLSKLEKIYALEKLKPTILEAKDLSFIVHAINNNFDYSPYFTKYEEYINQINILKNNLNIKIISNTKNTHYKEYLKELLTKENYKVSNSNEDVIIKISNNIRYSTARGWQIVKASSTLNIISNNKTVSTKTISTIGRSSSTKQNALQSSALAFKKKIQKIGIDKILYQ